MKTPLISGHLHTSQVVPVNPSGEKRSQLDGAQTLYVNLGLWFVYSDQSDFLKFNPNG